jgi:hypothetical protein
MATIVPENWIKAIRFMKPSERYEMVVFKVTRTVLFVSRL